VVFTLRWCYFLFHHRTDLACLQIDRWHYDFTLMTFAAFLVFGVVSVLPAIMWGAMRYIGLGSLGFINLLSLYGYSTLVFIPAAVRAGWPLLFLC
jgi:hypothetical protein